MNAPAGIQHRQRRIGASVIQARQPHALQRVPIFVTTLCRVRQGEKVMSWDDRQMRVGSRHLILMPAGREVGVGNYPGAQGFYIADTVSFPTELLRTFIARHSQQLAPLPGRGSTQELCVPLDRHTTSAWENLLEAINADSPDALCSHYAEAVLLALALGGWAGPLLRDRNDPLCERVQQIVMGDPARDWTVAGVAERLNLGASTLRRQLANEDDSFSNILENVRLGMALQWLQTTPRPIGEIAAASGYASASRFAVRFRKHYGLSPRELRGVL
ncbi:helix-turn-helix transcriptional regulator [Pseudomonas gingeri]|uniref:helix-turn-helix transcriptional regulator n=1 Tax=Pseudomonas gingeri TaxID=117681 RepID=UPI0015A1E68E|nr:helix-turn-helix transcriptional regulator [Pseudomonas gingeri]NWA03848.1 helix-turn-helix transcriptional regulator [Pseudomonas gingeri]NWA12748.1 helix-turn-helix transcriptional regulator [Pseudomonas gingeri]NWA58835.1 helix-turn-helix transcriptional regulator [Pseudomonas gingeri]NWA94399.1 helix-turn-helix transcriptional regulator [Pseudomonas gingeri]NWB01055.1 helix-turn-helix transcriptional regulator [Pseudomonas gingeri]